MNTFAIEVQHSSDKKLDGVWFEIERHAINLDTSENKDAPAQALALVSRLTTLTLGYIGRPVRIIEVA